jgi:hypothetical protein
MTKPLTRPVHGLKIPNRVGGARRYEQSLYVTSLRMLAATVHSSTRQHLICREVAAILVCCRQGFRMSWGPSCIVHETFKIVIRPIRAVN